MAYSVGISLGAGSVSFVKLETNPDGKYEVIGSKVIAHCGNPKKVIAEELPRFNPEKYPTAVTGRKFRNIVSLSSIPEPLASELSLQMVRRPGVNYTAIASLGGETFLVYSLDKFGKISNIITKNQCASGTGEFFLQQIGRMNAKLEETQQMIGNSVPYRVSGRCSVFCKSDCTHALNKGTPKGEVLAGLAMMMADKIKELLAKNKNGRALLVGGVTLNRSVMRFLRESEIDFEVPESAPYFEALGSAIYAAQNEVVPIGEWADIFAPAKSSFVFHQPLDDFQNSVSFKQMNFGTAAEVDKCVIGLDVGSTTTKAVLVRTRDNAILAKEYLYTHGDPIAASRKCYSALSGQLQVPVRIVGIGTTGSGRHIAGLHALTNGIFNEIIAHATAAVYFDPEVDTIFEIGGQDAKYTHLVNRVPSDYAMNEACSAGTGSFIEESAKESLGLRLEEIEPLALAGANPPNFSDQCSAFISSDIKTALQEGLSLEDIVSGLCYSVCLNYVNRVKGARPVGNKVFMQGGVCYNRAIPVAMAALTGKEIIVPPEPGLMGAYGAALEIWNRIENGIVAESTYSLDELARREVAYREPFTCRGGREKCDIGCRINMIEVLGHKYPFGGACDKYYNEVYSKPTDPEKYDYVKLRNSLTFGKYAPDKTLPSYAPTVGLNQSFHLYNLYPLLYNFFTELGFRVVLSETVGDEGRDRELSSFCYPAQLSLGLFQDLIDKNCDWYFVPNILEMPVEEHEYQRLDFNCTCVFVSGEPYYLSQAYKDKNLGQKMITPSLNFANGYEKELQAFVGIARAMGIEDAARATKAFKRAVEIQREYQDELIAIGRELIEHLRRNPDEIAIALVGRPYNTFNPMANKGIPLKFASRGVYCVPFDMLDWMDESVDEDQFWEAGKKILKAAKHIKANKQLFATYVTNFSCGPDSMIITSFRNEMGSKPALTLELDGHTADAGINTRIDAALDIIRNYRRIESELETQFDETDTFHPARIEFTDEQGFFIASDGKRIPLADPRVALLIPSMGDLAARLFAATLRSMGYNAIPMPEGNPEILKYGRAVATGKECLPLILCSGAMLDYLENRRNGTEYVAFFIVQGAGNCRLGQYPVFMRDIIKKQRLENVTTLTLMNEDGFAGLGPKFASRGITAIIASDVLDDIRSGIMAHAADPKRGMEIFEQAFERLLKRTEETPDEFYKALNEFAKIIAKQVPARKHISEARYIALLGEIYVRRDHFAHKWLNKYFADRGFILKDAYISEWIFYVDYLLKLDLLEPDTSAKKKLERLTRIAYMKYSERRIKRILEKTGYYHFTTTKIEPLLNHSKHIIPLSYKGEPGLTLGIGMHETIEKYCGIINLGPFGCMPTRLTEAVMQPEMTVGNKIEVKRKFDKKYTLPDHFDRDMIIPCLTIETDGNVYPQVIEAKLETFALQAERMAELMEKGK